MNITNDNQPNMTPNYLKRGNAAVSFEKRSSLPIVVESNPLKIQNVQGGALEGQNGGGTLVLVNEPHFTSNLVTKSSMMSK